MDKGKIKKQRSKKDENNDKLTLEDITALDGNKVKCFYSTGVTAFTKIWAIIGVFVI